jgi:hypothetical protein
MEEIEHPASQCDGNSVPRLSCAYSASGRAPVYRLPRSSELEHFVGQSSASFLRIK